MEPLIRMKVPVFSGEKGLWSVAEEAFLPRAALGGDGSAAWRWVAFAAALLEAVTVAVHLEYVDVMGETIE